MSLWNRELPSSHQASRKLIPQRLKFFIQYCPQSWSHSSRFAEANRGIVRLLGVAMSKREWFGLAVLGLGSLFGFLLGGMFGLGLAAVCLVIGLVLVVASTALGSPHSTTPSAGSSSKTSLLVLVKEVHARPQRFGKFQEIHNLDQSDLQFEIFVHCWLVNDTDQPFGVPRIQVSLTRSDSSTVVLQQLCGDLNTWSVGRLRDELDCFGVRYLQAASEKMTELDLTDPLEGGATRQGWLHLQAQGLTPKQLRDSSITLTIFDAAGQTHIGIANGPHQVPGRIWPLTGRQAKLPSVPESSPQSTAQA